MRRALSLSAAALVLLVSAEASASFHFIKVVEVFAGSAAAPDAHYIQLQAYAAGQNFVSGHVVRVYDSTGAEIPASLFTFAGNVSNSSDQMNILIGTAAVSTAFGVVPDFTLPVKLSQAGGAVCFDATSLGLIDCFSWGSFQGAAADGAVTPFNALTAGKAARRSIASGDPALLEAADDSNNVFADFTAVDPTPKNNTGAKADAGAPVKDAGTTDSGTVTPPGKDAGVGTQPSPNNPTVTPDSGTTTTTDGSSGDDSGCSLSAGPSGGWSTALGLVAAASMMMMSRRRRKKA